MNKDERVDVKEKKLLEKQVDYRRFVITLLIISSYLYMGSFIYVFIQPAKEANILCILSLISACVAIWFMHQFYRIDNQLNS